MTEDSFSRRDVLKGMGKATAGAAALSGNASASQETGCDETSETINVALEKGENETWTLGGSEVTVENTGILDSDTAAVRIGNNLKKVDEGQQVEVPGGYVEVDSIIRTGETSGITEVSYHECDDHGALWRYDAGPDHEYDADDIYVDNDFEGYHEWRMPPGEEVIFNQGGNRFRLDTFDLTVLEAGNEDDDQYNFHDDEHGLGIAVQTGEEINDPEYNEVDGEIMYEGGSMSFEVGGENYTVEVVDVENPGKEEDIEAVFGLHT